MGVLLSKAWDRLFGKKEFSILMLGLDASGKTTALYQLKLGEVVHTMPTIGFNVEAVEYKKINFMVWDVGGQHVFRPLWRHYFNNAQGLIYIVDSNDTERIDEARDELQKMLTEDELKDTVLLVLANKQDLMGSLSPAMVAERLGLPTLRGRKWHIQGCCATTGDGLTSALDWLADNIPSKQMFFSLKG